MGTYFENSFGNSMLWREARTDAWPVKSIRDESSRRYWGISAVWPVCDMCTQRVRRIRITIGALAATWILSFIFGYAIPRIAGIELPAAVGIPLFFLTILAFIGMAVVAYRFNRGGHSNSEANRDLTAVIVHSPHPNFYAEASRQIRMRGYGSTGTQGYR